MAARDATRPRGLMFRKSLPTNHGMLFVFDSKSTHCMWMRNTLMPLSVAFIDDEGYIINIEDMQPQHFLERVPHQGEVLLQPR